MSIQDPQTNEPSRLDDATADRLARLRTMPVDTTRLDKRLSAQLPPHPDARPAQRPPALKFRPAWLRPMRAAAAAVLLLAAVLTGVLMTHSRPAMASPAQMAQMHHDLVSGRLHRVQVDSIEAANRELTKQAPRAPEVPDAPQQHVMACCMRSVKNKEVACVLLRSDGAYVTMAVANAKDVRPPQSPAVVRHGVTYHVESIGLLNMVMTERQGRWVCMMGEIPTDRLIELASKLEF